MGFYLDPPFCEFQCIFDFVLWSGKSPPVSNIRNNPIALNYYAVIGFLSRNNWHSKKMQDVFSARGNYFYCWIFTFCNSGASTDTSISMTVIQCALNFIFDVLRSPFIILCIIYGSPTSWIRFKSDLNWKFNWLSVSTLFFWWESSCLMDG